MAELRQAIEALQAAQQQINALRSGSDQLVQGLPDVTTENGRRRLQQVVVGLGSALEALTSSWDHTQRALQTAAQLPAPQAAEEAGAASSTSGLTVGPEAGEAAARAAAEWCTYVGHELEEAVALKLMVPIHVDMAEAAGPTAKRRRTGYAPAKAHEELARVLGRVRQAVSGITLHTVSPAGIPNAPLHDTTELRLLCPRVFCASLVFARRGGLQVVRVALDAASNVGNVDGWGSTEHQVFRRLGALATRVLSYYAKRAPAVQLLRSLPNTSPESAALEDLLLWLCCYQGLFSTPCSATGRLVALDPSVQVPMPPIFRPYKLSRSQLLSLMQNPSSISAYHMHVAPEEELGWVEEDFTPAIMVGTRSLLVREELEDEARLYRTHAAALGV